MADKKDKKEEERATQEDHKNIVKEIEKIVEEEKNKNKKK